MLPEADDSGWSLVPVYAVVHDALRPSGAPGEPAIPANGCPSRGVVSIGSLVFPRELSPDTWREVVGSFQFSTSSADSQYCIDDPITAGVRGAARLASYEGPIDVGAHDLVREQPNDSVEYRYWAKIAGSQFAGHCFVVIVHRTPNTQ